MTWTTAQFVQLILAAGLGTMLFLATYLSPQRYIMWGLLILIPFQIIDSQYGSINTVLTYMVAFAFLLKRRYQYLPMKGIIFFMLLAYMLSFSQSPPGTNRDHGIYMIAIFSNILIFYLVYNFVRKTENYRDIWYILAIINVLVVIHCGLELIAGKGQINLFGVSEWAVTSRRADHGRLSGPFFATAMTAEYLGIQALICIYALIQKIKTRERVFWLGLLGLNLAFMIATGNRGGVVSLVIGMVVLMFLFRRELGIIRILTWTFTGSLVFVLAAFLIVQYTSYNVLFERLEETKFEGGVPDTRVGWFDIWGEVMEKPVLGHGPRLRLWDEKNRKIPGYTPIPYPHSGYIYLIFTVGFVGLAAYLWFFMALTRQYWRAGNNRAPDPLLQGMPRLALAILALFAVSQLRMEMFRFILADYQQFIFMLTAAMLALSHRAILAGLAKDRESPKGAG